MVAIDLLNVIKIFFMFYNIFSFLNTERQGKFHFQLNFRIFLHWYITQSPGFRLDQKDILLKSAGQVHSILLPSRGKMNPSRRRMLINPNFYVMKCTQDFIIPQDQKIYCLALNMDWKSWSQFPSGRDWTLWPITQVFCVYLLVNLKSFFVFFVSWSTKYPAGKTE